MAPAYLVRGLFPGWRFFSIGEVVVFCQVGKGFNVFASANSLIACFLLLVDAINSLGDALYWYAPREGCLAGRCP